MTEPYLFVSHASADKQNPVLYELVTSILTAGADIPLGIDTPSDFAPALDPRDFSWTLPRHEDWSAHLTAAITQTSVCTLIVLSRAYLEEESRSGRIPWTRWKEAVLAQGREAQQGSSYKVFYVWLEDLTENPRMPLELSGMNAARIYQGRPQIKALIEDIRTHFENIRQAVHAPDRALAAYLSAVRAKYEQIPVFGFRHRDRWLRLEQVFAALRGNLEVAAEERESAYLAFQEGLDAFGLSGANDEDIQATLSRQSRGRMRGLGAGPDRDGAPSVVGMRLTLAKATQTLRRLVILGGPGSGKTTLAQWLALAYARTRLDGNSGQIRVPQRHVDPESDSDALVVLGAVRTPILIRIQEYAEAMMRAPGRRLALIDFFGDHDWRPLGIAVDDHALDPNALTKAFRAELAAGRVVVILDGLDEINETRLRRQVLDEIEAFDRNFVRSELGYSPEFTQYGNQLIVTSRIVGYEAMRLPPSWRHVTIEEMSEQTVRRYWTRLFTAISTDPVGPVSDETQKKISDDVERLSRQVFGAGPIGVGELARVPLLATIIAATFDANDRENLPEHRVEIYETVTKTLVEEWRDTGVQADQWTAVLAPIAYDMHERAGESMLTHQELTSKLTARLGDLDGLTTAAARRDAVTVFMERVNAKVGLLAARRPGVYAFLHRTFQEYIAAYHFVESRELAPSRIMQRWLSPRWREVVLLAIGRVSLPASGWTAGERERLLLTLVDEALRQGLTQPLLLLAGAMAEMVEHPPEKAFATLARELVLKLDSGTRQTVSEADLADACAVLCGRAPHLMADVLVEMFASSDTALVRAAARQVRREGWLAPRLTLAIEQADATADDEAAALLQSCLVRAAQRLPKLVPPEPPTRLTSEEDTDLARSDPSGYRQYVQDLAQAEARYRSERRRFAALQALSPKQAYRRNTPLSDKIRHPETRELIDSDFGWRAVITGLYGGIDDLDAMVDYQRYHELARFLQYSDEMRKTLLQHRADLRWQFVSNDMIHGIAVALDQGKVDVKRAREAPTFDPERLVSAAPAPDLLTSCLDAARPSSQYASSGARALKKRIPADQRARLAFSVILADLDGMHGVSDIVRRLDKDSRRALRREARRALGWVADACFRALSNTSGPEGSSAGEALAEDEPERKTFAQRVAIQTGVRLFHGSPFLLGRIATSDEQSVAAESTLLGFAAELGDDLIYSNAVVFDTIGGRLHKMMMYAPEAAVAPWLEYLGWPVSGFAPPPVDPEDDLPVHVEGFFDTAPVSRRHVDWHGVLFSLILTKVTDPDLRAMLEARAFDAAFMRTVFGTDTDDAPRKKVEDARAIKSPYYRARTLSTLAAFLGRGDLALEAMRDAKRIADPLRRALVFEQLAAVTGARGGAKALRRAEHAVRQIDDPSTAWRMKMRLAERATERRASALQRSALMSFARVQSPWPRAVDAWALFRLASPDIIRRATRSRRSNTLPARLARGDLRAAIGAMVLPAQADSVLPIYVARAAYDVLDALEREDQTRSSAQRSRWGAVAKGSVGALVQIAGSEAIERQLTQQRAKQVAALAARTRKRGGDTSEIAYALPELSAKDAWGLKASRQWLAGKDPLLKAESAVRLGHHYGVFEPDVVGGLALASRANTEPQVLRASLLLSNGHFYVDRPPPRLRTSQLDPKVLEICARELNQPWSLTHTLESQAKRPFAHFVSDIYFDDVGQLETTLSNATKSDEALQLLSRVRFTSERVAELLMHALPQAPEPVQATIATTLANVVRTREPAELASWFRTSAPAALKELSLCPFRVAGIFRSLEAAFETNQSRADDAAPEIARLAASHFRRNEIRSLAELVSEGVDLAKAMTERSADATVWSGTNWTPRAAAWTGSTDGGTADLDHLLKIRPAAPVIKALAHWIETEAGENTSIRERSAEFSYLCFAASFLAARAPDRFWRSLEDRPRFIERVRLRAFTDLSFGQTAVAATRLLATDGAVDRDTIDYLLRYASGPDPFSARTVEHALRSVSTLSDDAVAALLGAVSERQPRVGAVSARTLALVARDPLTEPRQRAHIVAELTRISSSPRADVPIWLFLEGSGKDPGFVQRFGRLGDSLLEALAVIDRSL